MSHNSPFGKLVKKHRTGLGLTQAQLSSRVDRATITIRKIEAGVLRPSAQTAKCLALALDILLDAQLAFIHLATGQSTNGLPIHDHS